MRDDESPTWITVRDSVILKQTDGHFCYDWDGLAVSALTPEYDACDCYPKSLLGRLLNWLYTLWFNVNSRHSREGAE